MRRCCRRASGVPAAQGLADIFTVVLLIALLPIIGVYRAAIVSNCRIRSRTGGHAPFATAPATSRTG